VKRVRGKNILWLTMIALLFSVSLITLTGAAPGAQVYVAPAEIHNEDLSLSSFTIDINVEEVVDLYSFAFTLKFSPYVQNLVVSSVTEGGFLTMGGYTTDFVYKIDAFHGEVDIGNARLGQVPGASGSGTLATIGFNVEEAGSSPLALLDVELYNSPPDSASIRTQTHDGHYYGSEAEFVDISFDPGRAVNLKEFDALTIHTSVTNTGDIPLQVRVRFDLRSEDAWHQAYGGQHFVSKPRDPVYLYVNEYNPFLEWGWTNPGASVIGMPDGDFTESITNGDMTSAYGFEDLTDMGPTDVIGNVVLEGYCQYPNGPTEAVDIDIYDAATFAWWGSLYGAADWGWVTPRWIGASVSDVDPSILGADPTNLNNLEALIYNYEGSAANPMRVDALRLRVEFAKFLPGYDTPWVGTLDPGETAETEITWLLANDDMARYTGKVTVEFTHNGYSWIQADPKDFHLKIFKSGKPF
jgi:hypothetical protein